MGCDKLYGTRQVWIGPEAFANDAIVFTGDDFIPGLTASTFPALTYDMLDNTQATGHRGQSTSIKGSQAELSWDLTLLLPGDLKNIASYPRGVASLFWAAGFGGDAAPGSGWDPTLGTSHDAVITAKSACGRTIQMASLDRDNKQIEILTGCVVSQVVFNYSRGDAPTVVFSGVAARKLEAAQIYVTAYGPTDYISDAVTRTSYNSDWSLGGWSDGFTITADGDTTHLSSIYNGGVAHGVFAGSGTTPAYATISGPTPTASLTGLGPEDWSISNALSLPAYAQSASITIETGQGYGELTTEQPWPTEILSGQVKVSGSITAYITDAVRDLVIGLESNAPQEIQVGPTSGGGGYIAMPATLTEAPAIDLNSVDTPASGDITFSAYQTGYAPLTDNALTCFYIGH